MDLFARLFRYSPRSILVAIVAGAISGLCNAGLLAILSQATIPDGAWSRSLLVWGFVALWVLLPATRLGSSLLLAILGQGAVLRLRLELTTKILSAPFKRIEQLGAPKLLAALTNDAETIVRAMTTLPLLLTQMMIILGCLAYLGVLSWKILGIFVAMLGVGLILYRLLFNRALHYHRQAREEADRLWAHFRGVTEGIKELKLHSQRKGAFLGEMDATSRVLKKLYLTGSVVMNVATGWGQVVVFGIIGFIVFVIPMVEPVPLTTLNGYVLGILYVIVPIQVLLGELPELGRAGIAYSKIRRLGISLGPGESGPAGPADRGTGIVPVTGWKTLELAGVVHSFHDDEGKSFVLGPLDLRLRPGELTFLIGGNGSGKTTLIKLLIGLYVPEQGEVRIDGRPVTEETLEQYNNQFSVVFCDFYLFDSFLGLGGPEIDERAREYLRRLELDHKVWIENGVLSTTALSQGQRKRLALLTAYLEDRPIYVFDEWAADQDPVFKDVFYFEILPELKARGKTVVAISHDDRYYGVADRVVKLQEGKVEYDGPAGAYTSAHRKVAAVPLGGTSVVQA
jgi:putative ATP-binding cassette transporter